MTTYYSESFERAQSIARSAYESMELYRVPATPNNFCVWYGYHAGRIPEIVKAIDSELAGNREFSNEFNEELFESYFGSAQERRAVEQTSSEIEGTIEAVLSGLARSNDQTADYGRRLESLTDQIDRDEAAENIGELLKNLLSETREVIEQNRDLEATLHESADRITQLRETLEKAQEEALTDALTGAPNRKYFDLHINKAVEANADDQQPVSLLMLDVDHFKAFNDKFGHQVGDDVLKLVARVLTSGLKGRDSLARYGGEEFAAILPSTQLSDALIVAEQLRKDLGSRQLRSRASGERYGSVTISIGAAQYRSGEEIGAWIERADRALYAAKHGGRNQVAAEEPEAESRLKVG